MAKAGPARRLRVVIEYPGLPPSDVTPLPVLPLIGRERDALEVLDSVAGAPIVTLTGPAGVGKSSLASEVARRLALDAGAGPVTLRLASSGEGSDLVSAAANAMLENAAEPAGGCLVLLDDCDRVARECAEMAEVLVGRGLRVLATARQPLGAQGEAVWRVGALSLPDPDETDVLRLLGSSPAAQLFCERAVAADREFAPSTDAAPAIANICVRLDGVPLAIELAARRVAVYSPAEISERLCEPLALLTGGACTDPRHSSMREALDWTWHLLPSQEQRLLQRLSVFRGAFSETAAFQVCADQGLGQSEFYETLRTIADRSFLEVDKDSGAARFRLLAPTRHLAEERLITAGEETEVALRHAAWCVELVTGAGDPRCGSQWMDRLKPFHDQIHAGLEWALHRGSNETATALGVADSFLCRSQLMRADVRTRLERVVEASSAVDAVEALRLRTALASVRILTGDRHALSDIEAAAEEARKAGDQSLRADALAALGGARLLFGELAQAHDLLAESQEIADVEGDEAGKLQAVVGRGRAQLALGRYPEANSLLREGLERARRLGDPSAAAVVLASLGESARLCGDGTAHGLFSEAADLARRSGNPYPLGLALLGMGRVARPADERASRAAFEEVIAIADQCPLPFLLVPGLCGLAELVSESEGARHLVDRAATVAGACGDRAGEAMTYESLARLTAVHDDDDASILLHRQALLLRHEVGDPAAIALSIDALAMSTASSSDLRMAAQLFGATDSLRERHGIAVGWLVETRTRAIRTARNALGHHRYDSEWRRGRRLSVETAVAVATKPSRRKGRRPTTGWEALTQAERKVARAASQGRTNIQIARHLRIAEATVKAHLRRVYAKVEVQGRAELAAEASKLHPDDGGADILS